MSQPQDHSAARRFMSMKNSNDTIGNQTRDLLACSAVPQPTAPPAACSRVWLRWTNYRLTTSLQSNKPKSCPQSLTWLASVSSEVGWTGFSDELTAVWLPCATQTSSRVTNIEVKVSSFLTSSSCFWYKHMPMIPLVSGQPNHRHPWDPPNFQVPS